MSYYAIIHCESRIRGSKSTIIRHRIGPVPMEGALGLEELFRSLHYILTRLNSPSLQVVTKKIEFHFSNQCAFSIKKNLPSYSPFSITDILQNGDRAKFEKALPLLIKRGLKELSFFPKKNMKSEKESVLVLQNPKRSHASILEREEKHASCVILK